MVKNLNLNKVVDMKNALNKTSFVKENIKNNIPVEEIVANLDSSNIKRGIVNKFNDQKAIVDSSIPKWVLEQIAKYPKGTFRRVNKTMEIDGVMRRIVFEGLKVDFDVTEEGFQIIKQKMRLF
jgi:hypothetical protein